MGHRSLPMTETAEGQERVRVVTAAAESPDCERLRETARGTHCSSSYYLEEWRAAVRSGSGSLAPTYRRSNRISCSRSGCARIGSRRAVIWLLPSPRTCEGTDVECNYRSLEWHRRSAPEASPSDGLPSGRARGRQRTFSLCVG